MSIEADTRIDTSHDDDDDPHPDDDEPEPEREPQLDAGGPDAGVAAGTRLGRYVVLERLGAGGMGVVYAAWDPRLDRKLALKLLLGSPRGSASEGQARLLREAQALARLVHPNVVAIHDVGTVGDRVFLAMEFVDGQSLRAWIDAGPHAGAEILAVFVAAGRGLEAAHAAGLIHRDVKPENVIVGADGRVRVLDFGLARRGDDVAEPGTGSAAASSDPGAVDTQEDSLGSLTRTGVLIGTPAYMSPEQFRGDPLDARSDQFSFCVALWEALAGQRPFAGSRRAELVAAVSEGARRPFPRGRVPDVIVAAIERGLAPNPEDRWPDMSSLLDALAPAQPVRRSPWIPAALIAAALLLGLGLGIGLLGDREVSNPDRAAAIDCEVDDARLDGIWDEPRAAALERGFTATELPWARTSAARVRARLDDWTVSWRSAVEDACVAHHERHELSAELFDLRMACLDQRLRALDSLVGLLTPATPDPRIVEQAIAASSSLESVAACSDLEQLRAAAPPEDPQLAARLAELDSALDRREQMQDLAMHREALAEDERLRPELEAVDLPGPWARHFWLRALDLLEVGEPEAAIAAATEAVAAGRRASPTHALNAVLVIARVTLRNSKPDESERWLRLGEAIGEEVDDPRLHYELLKARGFLQRTRGELDAALATFTRLLDVARRDFGERSIEVATELTNYGEVAAALAATRPELAEVGLDAQRESAALMREAYAADHPLAIQIRINLGVALLRSGHEAEALAELDALGPLVEQAYEPDHELRRAVMMYRARVLEALGRCDEAAAGFDAYLAWVEEFRPHEPSKLVVARTIAGSTCDGTRPDGLELLDAAVDAGFVDGEPLSGASMLALMSRAYVRFIRGQLDGAQADVARARELTETRPEITGVWRSNGHIAIMSELLLLARAPDDTEAQARLREHRDRLDPVFERDILALIDRALGER